jgi:hypothetical protein
MSVSTEQFGTQKRIYIKFNIKFQVRIVKEYHVCPFICVRNNSGSTKCQTQFIDSFGRYSDSDMEGYSNGSEIKNACVLRGQLRY